MHWLFNLLKKPSFILFIGCLLLMVSTSGFSLNTSIILQGEDSVFSEAPISKKIGSDFELLSHHERKNPYPQRKKPGFLLVGKSDFSKYNPVSLLFGGMLFTYQAVISSQIAADCPYEISCSAFSKRSIQEFGLIKGLALSADRLTRCTKPTIKRINPLRINKEGMFIDDPSYYRLQKKSTE